MTAADAASESAALENLQLSAADPDRQAQEELGRRLRAARNAAGLSLQGVEDASRGEWKAVVVGSYERGDRSTTIGRLIRLCEFYGVTLYDVLPMPEHLRQRLVELEAEHEQLQRRTAMRLAAQLLGYAAACLQSDAGTSSFGPEPPPEALTTAAVTAATAALNDAVLRIGVADDGDRFTAVNQWPPRDEPGPGVVVW